MDKKHIRRFKANGWVRSEMYVYVIQNSEGVIYVGITKNLVTRLDQHRSGQTRSTNKGCLDWEVVHYWNCDDYVTASKMERMLHKVNDTAILCLISSHPKVDDFWREQCRIMRTTDFETKTERQRNWIMEGRGPLPEGLS